MKFSNEILMAYADGELDAALRAQIEMEMERDPALADAVRIQIRQREELQAKLRTAFNSALQEGVPERLIAATEATPSITSSTVAELALRRAEKPLRASHRWTWPQWAAIAASLLLGVFAGRATLFGSDEPFVAGQGRMLAHGALDSALTEQSSGSIDPETDIQVGVSYFAKGGHYCRTFTFKDEQALAGIACRRDSQWAIDVLMRTNVDASGAYRMAGGTVPPLILSMVEDTIAGEPLDAEQESEARAHGWEQ